MPATFQVEHALRRFAADPQKMYEVAVQPKSKIDIGGGKSFWTYRVVVTGKEKDRGAVYALSAPAETKQLPEAKGTYDTATGEVRDRVPAQA